MTRKKVKLAYIANDSSRKATFKKRKKGLMKKVSELSTLCGIDACAIIYGPYDSQPEVWPSPLGVQRVLAQFKKMPEMEQSKKMVNQESFLRQRITKAREQLKKIEKENREKELVHVMYQCLSGQNLQYLSMMDLNDLSYVIEHNLKEIQNRSEAIKKGFFAPPFALTAGESSSAAAAVSAAAGGVEGLVLNPVMATPNNHHHQIQEYHEEKPLSRHHLPYSYEPPHMNANNIDALQRQQWFLDLIHPTTDHHQMSAGASSSLAAPPGFAAGTSTSLAAPPGFAAGTSTSLAAPPGFAAGTSTSLAAPSGFAGGGGEDHSIMPFGDNININPTNNNAAALWSNAFFGWDK